MAVRKRQSKNAPKTQQRISLTADGAQFHPQRSPGAEPNAIRTTRFTPLSWLPKSLWLQFHRAANVYFVFIAIISTVPWMEAKWQPKVLTVVLILLAQALKDGYEDIKRWRDDQAENSRPVQRFVRDAMEFQEARWCEIDAGEVLLIERGEPIPADTLVIASAENSGVFYVATKSLDGETNLKERQAPAVINDLWAQEAQDLSTSSEEQRQAALAQKLHDLELEVHLEAPHPRVMDMNCSVRVRESEHMGVGRDNFGLRGCELQNTSWVLGIACYVGPETKVRLNSFPPPSKSSELERFLNNCVLSILGFLFLVSIYFAIASRFMIRGEHLPFCRIFLKYLVILYPVLPMTLYIAFEILHLIVGVQIELDPLMNDEKTGASAKARNTSVLEEMGQVDFVFSDKTGTLTANEMRFAYCCAGQAQLGPFLPGEDPNIPPAGLAQAERLLRAAAAEPSEARYFFEALAVCHTVKMDEEDRTYQGESPDEVALVDAARSVGVELVAREANGPSVIHRVSAPWGTEEHEITHVLGFSSDRKRMSVVCAKRDGGAVVITKGADSVMEGLLAEPLPREATQALEEYSRLGLRTLVVARRQLSAAEFATWRARWEEAGRAMDDRAAKLECVSAAAEVGFQYVGVTALEDRLQDRVPETIATLREAGIRVWVLTGDKVETAVEIAKSCNLLDSQMKLVRIVGKKSPEECVKALREGLTGCGASGNLKGMPEARAIILDGESVTHILGDAGARRELYRLAIRSSSCVCCRLSPLQKRELVELVRAENDQAITLAIGDGANDVPMIQGAHVGVGIRGKEGSASVQASDMAISQFSFLGNLLLCHGRKSYRRIATFLCFFTYKSVALGWSYIVYAHTMLFSGEGAYPQWLDVIWNPLTSCAVVLILASDRDYPDEVALKSPECYSPGPRRELFNARVFGYWMLLASIHGTLAWCVPVYGLTNRQDRNLRPLAEGGPFWQASFTAFTSVFLMVHLKLLLVAKWPLGRLGWMAFIIELLAYLPVALALGSSLAPSHELLGVPEKIATSRYHMLCLLTVPIVALSVDVAEVIYRLPKGRLAQLCGAVGGKRYGHSKGSSSERGGSLVDTSDDEEDLENTETGEE